VQSTLDQQTAAVDDLEASETPESILLSTVSGEQSKDRTDRAIVTPWLKFLWETYRTVLDIFKNNSRLEIMYQSTAHQAFKFCSKYQRKTEFRRLCELLRNHLQNVAKFSAQMHAINLSDAETLQRHLDTRFQQLNVAVELELWQEAFRSVEDIHNLFSLSKRPAKPAMMANYFEKLTKIFLVSENYLFHAAAWSRLNNLLRQSSLAISAGASKKDHPSVSESEMTKAASFVILSALSIPVISTARSRGAIMDAEEARKSKNNRLTSLLGMNSAPTRAVLFKDAVSKGLLRLCNPQIRELYNILEVDFHPLLICKRVGSILTAIGAEKDMETYVKPLQQVILTRLFQQLSQVYETAKIDFVLGLAQFPEPYGLSRNNIEKFIMNGCKKGDLAIRINHSLSVLTFDSDVFSSARALHPGYLESDSGTVQTLQSTPAEIGRSQLTRLAKSLHVVAQYVDPSYLEQLKRAQVKALQRAEIESLTEQEAILSRREIIEKKKAAASTALAQKEKELSLQKRLKEQEQLAAEQQRLAEEQRDRERRRLQAERARIQQEVNRKALEELKRGTKGIDLDSIDVTGLDTIAIRAIKIRALEKEKNDLSDKLRTTGRRVDHIERAYREEEIKILPKDYEAQRERDYKAWSLAKELTLKESEEKHKDDLELHHRLYRLVSSYELFRDEMQRDRKAEFDKRQRNAQRELEKAMDQRRKEFVQRKERERQERQDRERREREEEERREREEEEKAAAAEERRQRMEAEKIAREEERKYVLGSSNIHVANCSRLLDEKATLQREAEERAEAKLRAKRAGADSGPRIPTRDGLGTPRVASGEASSSTTTPSAAERPAGGRPVLTLQGRGGTVAKPSWRDREETKRESGAASSANAPPPRSFERPSGSSRAFDRSDAGERGERGFDRGERGERSERGFDRGERSYRPREDRAPREERSERPERDTETPPLPAPGDSASTGGRYRPGMFSRMRDGGAGGS
jgi:translation initiation factor 3 subunit A